MRFTRIALSDFSSYGSQEIDLDGLDYVAIEGRNGSGKSSIALGIAWALFGTARVKGDSDSVIRDSQHECSVTLDFVSDGNLWRIERGKKRGKSAKVRLSSADSDGNWTPYGDHLNATAQAQIEELIGMSEDAFYSLVVIDGDSGVRFVKADSAKRRDILLNLIPEMAQWPKLEEQARKMLAEERSAIADEKAKVEADEERIADTRGRASEAQAELDSLDVSSVESSLSSVESDIAKVSKRIESAAAEEQAALDKFDAAHESKMSRLESDIVKAESDESKVRSSFKRLVRIEEDLSDARRDKKESAAKVVELSKSAEVAKASLTEAEAALRDAPTENFIEEKSKELGAAESRAEVEEESLRGLTAMRDDHKAQCPTCQTHLSEAALDDLIRRVEESLSEAEALADSLDAQINDARRERRSAVKALESAEEAVSSAERKRDREFEREGDADDDVNRLSERLGDALKEEGFESVDDAEESVESAESRSQKARRKRDDAEEEYQFERRPLADAVDDARRDAKEGKDGRLLSELRESKVALSEKLREADTLRGRIGTLNDTMRSISDSMRERRNAIKGTIARVDDLEQVVAACRPQGVPSMLLDSILAPIESEATKILNEIPGGEGMSIRFEQVRALKSRAGAKEVLDIIVSFPHGAERPIESLSSGEMVRASMSLIFAMINVLGDRRGSDSLDTIFLDEPLGALDHEAVPAFVEVLRSAVSSGTLSSVMVVAHDQRVIEALPQRITVERDEREVSHASITA